MSMIKQMYSLLLLLLIYRLTVMMTNNGIRLTYLAVPGNPAILAIRCHQVALMVRPDLDCQQIHSVQCLPVDLCYHQYPVVLSLQ